MVPPISLISGAVNCAVAVWLYITRSCINCINLHEQFLFGQLGREDNSTNNSSRITCNIRTWEVCTDSSDILQEKHCCFQRWCCFHRCYYWYPSLAHLLQALMQLVRNRGIFHHSWHCVLRLWSWRIVFGVHCQNAVICCDKQRNIQTLFEKLCETYHSFSKHCWYDVK